MAVFIEDTDTYGVVLNSNYLKFYDRALQQQQSLSSNLIEQVIIGVKNQKFRSSPVLGDEFVIQGILKDVDDSTQRQVWDLSTTSLDGSTVYHSATGVTTCACQGAGQFFDAKACFKEEPSISESYLERADSFIAYRDEFDPSMVSHLPLVGVLNHMERPRSNFIGGPKALRELRDEHGIVVVVSGIRDLYLFEHGTENLVGDTITVECVCHVRNRGMRNDVYETLVTSAGEPLAQGVVTILCLDKETFRPTSKLPPSLLDTLKIR